MKHSKSLPAVLVLLGSLTACSQQVKIPEATEIASPEKAKVVVKHVNKPNHHAAYARQRQVTTVKPFVYNTTRPAMPGHSRHELRSIGDKIFKNEAGSVKSKLVHWNRGENFAAMGIGHFTWYPAGPRRHRFGNTFPGLLTHMEKRGVALPQWLKQAKRSGAPWNSRSALMRQKGSRKVKELENLLYATRDIQAEYIIQRAKRAMPKLVKKTPRRLRSHVGQNLNAVANTPGGWYALVDYVNFKGEGLRRNAGYKGQNWGLLQVLENMHPSAPGQEALNNFSSSALFVLTRRVKNSPPRRNERRWLAGWTNRVDSYRNPLSITSL